MNWGYMGAFAVTCVAASRNGILARVPWAAGLAAIGVALLAAPTARAAAITWAGGAAGLWDSSANWNPPTTWTAPGNTAVFNTVLASVTVNSVSASGITFTQAAAISGGMISLAAGSSDLANNAPGMTTISSALNFTGSASSYWTSNSAGTLNIAGPVSASVGHLFIDEGNYTLGSSGSITVNNFAIVLSDGGTTNLMQTGGLISVTRNNANGFYLSQGGGANYTMTGGSLVVGGAAGSSYTDLGYGDGTTTTLSISGASALVNSNVTLNFEPNAVSTSTLNLQNGTLQSDSIVSGGTAGTTAFNFSGGLLQPMDGNVTSWGTTSSATNFSVKLNGANATMSSEDASGVGRSVNVYANLGGNGTLNTTGSGTLVLGGSNTYSGGTNIRSGTLEASTTGSLPNYSTTGKISVAGGATLAIAAGGTGQWNSGASDNLDALLAANSGGFSPGASLGIDTSGGSFTYAGAIAGNMGLTKLGPNTLTLKGGNTYSGPTLVNAGLLLLRNGGSLGTSAITVAGAATFGVAQSGNGILNSIGSNLSLQSGANFTMIDGSIGSLQVRGSAAFNGGTLNFDIGGGSADLLAISGNAAAAGRETVSLNVANNASLTGTYTLITAGGQSTLNGASYSLTGGQIVAGGLAYPATLNASSGTALTLTVGAGAPATGFRGTPITFNQNGGWCWFQDPRAIIANGQLIIGSIAGTTGNGSNAGDADVTSYSFQTQTSTETLLHSELNQDDHACPAFAVLPDGRIMAVYATHGTTNNTLWRVSTAPGETTSWSAEQTSLVNSANDGNGNSYSNPFYLSAPNIVVNFSRAIGFDPNYSIISNLNSTVPTFTYGGHWMYWANPNNTPPLTGGDGRPYVKFASNGADTIWFATTEDSPQNYPNSLYAGYIKFTSSGSGSVYTSTGVNLGGLSTGTVPTGSSNPPAGGNQGDIPSGTGNSYLPTDFTPIVKANAIYNGVNLTGKYVGWASSMQLDSVGDPYLGFVVVDNLTGAYGNDLEYYYAHFNGSAWQVSRVGYAGYPLYNGQNQYAGLMAVDPLDPDKLFVSTDVDPATGATLFGPDGLQHWQILEGISPDGGSTWDWTQLTDTSSDNIRPEIVAGDGEEALVWEQGSYTSFTDYNMSMVGLVQTVPEPSTLTLLAAGIVGLALFAWRRHRSAVR